MNLRPNKNAAGAVRPGRSNSGRGDSLVARIVPPVAVFIVGALLAELIIRQLRVSTFLLPRPSQVLAALVNRRDELAASLWTTAQAALIGFIASAIFGILAAVVLSSNRLIRRAIYPYTIFFQTVPLVAVAPMLIFWFNGGLQSVSISAFIVSVFPVIANTLDGLLSTDPALVDLFRLYRAGPIARLWKLRLPAAVPQIITGLKVAAGLAVIGTVVGEFLVGTLDENEGLGVRINAAIKYAHLDLAFAAVLVASLLGLAMLGAISAFGRLLLRHWHPSQRSR
jgi:NitT/TauT family transport system permease protein